MERLEMPTEEDILGQCELRLIRVASWRLEDKNADYNIVGELQAKKFSTGNKGVYQ